MKKTINNIFFLDESVSKVLKKFKQGKQTKANVMKAGDSYIATLTDNKEKRTLIFRPVTENFTYEVNGHFYGTFFYDDEKIIAKWPKHLLDQDKRLAVNELQEFFRKYL